MWVPRIFHPAQETIRYSWMRPPRRSALRSLARSTGPGSLDWGLVRPARLGVLLAQLHQLGVLLAGHPPADPGVHLDTLDPPPQRPRVGAQQLPDPLPALQRRLAGVVTATLLVRRTARSRASWSYLRGAGMAPSLRDQSLRRIQGGACAAAWALHYAMPAVRRESPQKRAAGRSRSHTPRLHCRTGDGRIAQLPGVVTQAPRQVGHPLSSTTPTFGLHRSIDRRSRPGFETTTPVFTASATLGTCAPARSARCHCGWMVSPRASIATSCSIRRWRVAARLAVVTR